MSKFPLDLSKFKRVSSDQKQTVLKHDDGHQLVVNHAALDKKNLSALTKLPMLQQENKLPDQQSFSDGGNAQESKKNWDSGHGEKVLNYLKGRQEVIDQGKKAGWYDKPAKMASGGDIEPNPQPNEEPAPPDPDKEQSAIEADEDETPVPEISAVRAAAEASENKPAPIPEPEEEEPSPPAPSASPAPQAPAMDPQQKFIQDKMTAMNDVLKQSKALANDLQVGHIQPKTYQSLFEDRSTLGKIGTIFGLMLGGAGSGLTHTENPLIGMWKQQINNDLEAQKANLTNKQTLIGLNKERFQDLGSAINFSRMQQNQIALHDLATKVQTLPPGSPERVKAEAGLATVGQFVNTENYNIADQIASKQAFLGSFQNQGGDEGAFQAQQNMLRRGNEQQQKLAEENEKHHVAGIPGQSSIALTPDNRADLQGKQLLDQKLDAYINFANQNGGSINPRVIAQGKALAADLQGAYRQATHGGVYKEGESNFIQTLIDSNPTKFANNLRGVVPKAQELKMSNQQGLDSVKKSLGFPVQEQHSVPAQTAQTGNIFEGRTATLKDGSKVILKNGKWVPL